MTTDDSEVCELVSPPSSLPPIFRVFRPWALSTHQLLMLIGVLITGLLTDYGAICPRGIGKIVWLDFIGLSIRRPVPFEYIIEVKGNIFLCCADKLAEISAGIWLRLNILLKSIVCILCGRYFEQPQAND